MFGVRIRILSVDISELRDEFCELAGCSVFSVGKTELATHWFYANVERNINALILRLRHILLSSILAIRSIAAYPTDQGGVVVPVQ